MRIRGAVHVHSTLVSRRHDDHCGARRYFKDKGYHFLAMGEHAEDMTGKVQTLRSRARPTSSDDFCVIRGHRVRRNETDSYRRRLASQSDSPRKSRICR